MKKQKKDRMICLRLTVEAMALLDKVMHENGITRTTAIELAVRKQYLTGADNPEHRNTQNG